MYCAAAELIINMLYSVSLRPEGSNCLKVVTVIHAVASETCIVNGSSVQGAFCRNI